MNIDEAPLEVFVVEHLIESEDGREDIRLIGVFSSRELAEEVVRDYKKIPGFSSHPEGFGISRSKVDKAAWAEGFV